MINRAIIGACTIGAAVLAAGAAAQSAPAGETAAPDEGASQSAQGDVAITITNNNIALVQDVRQSAFATGAS